MDTLKQLIKFIHNLKGYWKLQSNYDYKPNTYDFIINQYETVLCERTKTMSKPTYYAKDVIGQIDKWYEDHEMCEVDLEDLEIVYKASLSVCDACTNDDCSLCKIRESQTTVSGVLRENGL